MEFWPMPRPALSRRALSHFAAPGQNAGRPLQFYDFDFFFAANMVC